MAEYVLVERKLLEHALRVLAGSAWRQSDESRSLENSLTDVLARTPPSLYIVLSGGMVQSVESDQPDVASGLDRVTVIDYDTEGVDKEAIVLVKDHNGWSRGAVVYEMSVDSQTVMLP